MQFILRPLIGQHQGLSLVKAPGVKIECINTTVFGRKCLDMAENGMKWLECLEMAGIGWNRPEYAEIG